MQFASILGDDKAQSLPDSPKPSGSNGDVSPLKEMLKHKWANKWEKRSLSLDLDLKGKIITAIEDKRKSIFSQFIAEETGIIPPSVSIAEHMHIGYAGDLDASIAHHHHGKYSHSHDCLQNCAETHGDVEEVGTDYLAAEDNHLDNILKFSVPPEELQEYFAGYSPLYHKHPRLHSELPNADQIAEIRTDDLKPISILNDIYGAISSHKWTKYFVGIAAVALFLPSFIAPFAWILVGAMAVIIFQETLLVPNKSIDCSANSAARATVPGNDVSSASSSDSVGSLPNTVSETQLLQAPVCEKRPFPRYASRSQVCSPCLAIE